MSERIIVTIDEEGNLSYQVEGVKGNTCTSEDYTFLDQLGRVKSRKKTKDYYQQVQTKGRQIGRVK